MASVQCQTPFDIGTCMQAHTCVCTHTCTLRIVGTSFGAISIVPLLFQFLLFLLVGVFFSFLTIMNGFALKTNIPFKKHTFAYLTYKPIYSPALIKTVYKPTINSFVYSHYTYAFSLHQTNPNLCLLNTAILMVEFL